MSKGFWIVKGDRTTCGGSVLNGRPEKKIGPNNSYVAVNGSPVSCGKHPGTYSVDGGYLGDIIHGSYAASSLYSRSTCPCRAFFIPSQTFMSHGPYQSPQNKRAAVASASGQDAQVAKKLNTEPEQHAQSAKKLTSESRPAPLPLPALIYQTKNRMDDYQAKDMHHGDLDILTLRNRFRIDVDNVSTKVNPYTLTAKAPLNPYPFLSPYERAMLPDEPVRRVSKEESAGLMFDEFRELAKVYSFHGPYKNIITEMITHMQENSGTPYSSPLLDRALKEQILGDQSEQSSLLKIKRVLKTAINYEYGFIPLDKKDKLFDERGNFKDLSGAVLPKFDRLIDKTNGLVITVHDTWSTHITLESLEVEGESFRAKVHYRIQDHFGLDDYDVLNPLYREFRIFRLWFTLQRWDEYGYRPFISEMNATVEISGGLGE
ncbi:PAAR domain-containing protein [Serratia sp. NPDC078593]|uniref:PAAR domain-containing protein n=1 Tax=unclassified Serratia (in: enterobacteria) TaxID=2647522 RepID=UPI0037D1A645